MSHKMQKDQPSGRAVRGVGLDSLDSEIMGSNPLKEWMFVLVFVLLSCVGRGLCDGPITRPKRSPADSLNRLRDLTCVG
jgi:hypothetical protein